MGGHITISLTRAMSRHIGMGITITISLTRAMSARHRHGRHNHNHDIIDKGDESLAMAWASQITISFTSAMSHTPMHRHARHNHDILNAKQMLARYRSLRQSELAQPSCLLACLFACVAKRIQRSARRSAGKKIPAIFQCKIPRQTRKKIFTKFFWRAGKVTTLQGWGDQNWTSLQA